MFVRSLSMYVEQCARDEVQELRANATKLKWEAVWSSAWSGHMMQLLTAEVKRMDKKSEVSPSHDLGSVQVEIHKPTGKILIHLMILQPLTLRKPILSQQGAIITLPHNLAL